MNDITKLQALECPFTWNIITKERHENQDDSTMEDQAYPLPKFLLNLMSVYMSANKKEDFKTVDAKLQQCKNDLVFFEQKEHPHISLEIIQHVVLATEIHVFNIYELFEEVESKLRNVTVLKQTDMTPKEKATLEACKSMAWSHHDLDEAIIFIQNAVKYNTECDLWQYTLGKELRRSRRENKTAGEPGNEEFACFKKAYYLARNLLCGVMYAQALRESRSMNEAEKIYIEIDKETSADDFYIQLKLALGFMQCRKFSKAKECLNNASSTHPNYPLYLHYRGMYHMKKKEFKEAAEFLERAITDEHFGVEKHYLQCKVQADKSFDAKKYVLKMIEKYKDFPVHVRQHLQLELAMCYEKNMEFNNAVNCFIKAINMQPKSSTLREFQCCVNRTQNRRNVYHFLKKEFLPRVDVRNIPAADTLRRLVNTYIY